MVGKGSCDTQTRWKRDTSVKLSLSLLEAARIGDSAIVQQHLEQGAGTDTLNGSLIEASRAGSDVVKLLLDNGAQVDLKNIDGLSALGFSI